MVKNMLENTVQNGIPLYSLILEPIAGFGIIYIAILLIFRFRERRRAPTFYLAMTNLFYGLGIWASAIGKYLDYFSSTSQDVISYSGFTINFAYCFAAVANAFLCNFIEYVYFSQKEWRMIIVGLLNGITIGFIFDVNTIRYGAYSLIFSAVIYHVLISFIINLLLAIFSFRAAKHTDDPVAKWGFRFIGLFGIMLILVFVFFGIDSARIIIQGTSYNLEYYLAWTSAVIGSIVGYLGYIMPSWFRNYITGGSNHG